MNPTLGQSISEVHSVAVRRTVVGEQQADWCLAQRTIRILRVRTATGELLAAASPVIAPDLLNMREWFPEPTPLWDAVRHQFWSRQTREGDAG